MSYSKFWMSILSRDLDGMKAHSTAMGIGELFPLLVCMVTGRTWDSVTAGIDRVEYSSVEVRNIVILFPLISIGGIYRKKRSKGKSHNS